MAADPLNWNNRRRSSSMSSLSSADSASSAGMHASQPSLVISNKSAATLRRIQSTSTLLHGNAAAAGTNGKRLARRGSRTSLSFGSSMSAATGNNRGYATNARLIGGLMLASSLTMLSSLVRASTTATVDTTTTATAAPMMAPAIVSRDVAAATTTTATTLVLSQNYSATPSQHNHHNQHHNYHHNQQQDEEMISNPIIDNIQSVLLGPMSFYIPEEDDCDESDEDDDIHPVLCHLQNLWFNLVLQQHDDDYCEGVVGDETNGNDGQAVAAPPERLPLAVPRGGDVSASSASAPSSNNNSHNNNKNAPYHFSLYQKGDGSETDPDHLPLRYLQMHSNQREPAKKSLDLTLEWRQQNGIDHILQEPHSKFDLCKQVFPHYFIGRANNGNVVFLQQPALIQLSLADRNSLTQDDLLRHYIYVNEYLWQILESQQPLSMMISIIDLQGLKFEHLRNQTYLGFLKQFITTMDHHYPQRAQQTLIINTPKWFTFFYKLLKPFLRETTKSKIQIVSSGTKEQDEIMQRYLSSLPQYDNTPLEQELKSFTLARLEEAGEEMQAIV